MRLKLKDDLDLEKKNKEIKLLDKRIEKEGAATESIVDKPAKGHNPFDICG